MRKFYKQNDVGYRYTNIAFANAAKITVAARAEFARRLIRLIDGNFQVVYLDETSFNAWMTARKTWNTRDQFVKIPLAPKRGKGITVTGAIGKCLKQAVFRHSGSTNKDDFILFLKEMRKQVKDRRRKIFAVMDNHKSHHTLDA